MTIKISQRMILALGFALCVTLIAIALYFQYGLGLEPCPLCILQRIVVMALGLVFVIAVLHNPSLRARRVYGILIILIAGLGLGIAGRQVWLQTVPQANLGGCGVGLDYMIETFPLSKTLELVFRGSGDCSEVQWIFLGLSIPAWMTVVFAGFIVLGALLASSRTFAR